MENGVKITLIVCVTLVVLALLVAIPIYNFFNIVSPSDDLRVQGEALIDVQPDIIGVYVNIHTENKSSEEARDQASKIYENLVLEMVRAGFSSEDLKSSGFSVNPIYDWSNGQSKITGYQVDH